MPRSRVVEKVCMATIWIFMSFGIQGCDLMGMIGCGTEKDLSKATGKWVARVTQNTKGVYKESFGWQFSKKQDPKKFSATASKFVSTGFEWIGCPEGAVASQVVGALADQIVKQAGDDWSSEVASESQTFEFDIPEGGGTLWQWEFNLEGKDKFTAKLKIEYALVTKSDSTPPACLPWHFVDIANPYGNCLSGPSLHYENPANGCGSDELDGKIDGVGSLCSPPCTSSGACPADVPDGVTAQPECDIQQTSTGKQFCALQCSSDSDCGNGNARCRELPNLQVNTMICLYPYQLNATGVEVVVKPQEKIVV